MMQSIHNPGRGDWEQLLKRPAIDSAALIKSVQKILDHVQKKGDVAVKKYTREFDGISRIRLEVSKKEISEAARLLHPELKLAIRLAAKNIETFHLAQYQAPEIIETMPGIQCWRKSVAIDKVGLYIPGGTAPLFSTILMLGIPAGIAGCREIILCSPPDKEGGLHPAILFAAELVGITRIFRIGGVQAIGAMAFGTATVPAVYKIFGPGNQYVTAAKQRVQQQGIAIDMPAGPSELAIYADEQGNPGYIAADLLSQAEHGIDSQVILICKNQLIASAVMHEMRLRLEKLPRKEFASKALMNSKLLVMENEQEAMDLLNEYAPEHLILACSNAEALAEQVVNAGSVFIGNYSPESAGDYASGTNHALPTSGYAKNYSGVSLDSFVKKITFQKLTKEGLNNIAGAVIAMAEAEGLQAHAEAVKCRLAGLS